MSYISDRVAGDGVILPSGLYSTIAEAPSYPFNQDGNYIAPPSSSPTRNVIEWTTRGNRVIVRGDGVKNNVSLYPTSGQHDSENYVLKNLRVKGLNPTSAIVKKIAKELDRLRRQRCT